MLLYIPLRGLEKGIEEICKTGSTLGNPVFTAVCTLLKHHRLLMSVTNIKYAEKRKFGHNRTTLKNSDEPWAPNHS